MDTNANTYSDYLMIIAPPAEVEVLIGKYKRSTAKVIGDFDGMHGKAHISVTNQHRQMPVMMVQKLDCYQRSMRHLQAIPITVNGFNFFKHGDTGLTIYAKIELNTQVDNWFIHVKRIFGDKTKAVVPHITVAKNIAPEKFKVLWPNFVGKQYRHDFTPQSITVLSRPMISGSFKPWTPMRELYFNNF